MAKAKKKVNQWPQPVAAYMELEAKHPTLVKVVRNLAKKKEQA